MFEKINSLKQYKKELLSLDEEGFFSRHRRTVVRQEEKTDLFEKNNSLKQHKKELLSLDEEGFFSRHRRTVVHQEEKTDLFEKINSLKQHKKELLSLDEEGFSLDEGVLLYIKERKLTCSKKSIHKFI